MTKVWSYLTVPSLYEICTGKIGFNDTDNLRLYPLVRVIIVLKGLPTLWPPLWPSGQSSWLQIQRSGFCSRRYQIFWEVVGLERGTLSLVSTTEELLERKISGSGLETREYGRRDTLHWPRGTLYQPKLTLTSLTSGGRSVGIVRSRTQATEFNLHLFV
jgi:hypothetical protein